MVKCWSTMSSAGVFDVPLQQCHLNKRYNWGLSVSNENFLFLLRPKICLIEPKEIFEYNESKISSLRQLNSYTQGAFRWAQMQQQRQTRKHALTRTYGRRYECIFIRFCSFASQKTFRYDVTIPLRIHVFLSAWLSYLILIQDRWGVKSRHLLDIMYTRGWPLQPYMNLIELIELNWTGYFLREYICALFANFIQTNNPWLNKCQITASTNTTGC